MMNQVNILKWYTLLLPLPVPMNASLSAVSPSAFATCPSGLWSSRASNFRGFNIHSSEGRMQFQRTAGNQMATPISTKRNTTSCQLRVSTGTFVFQNSDSVSEKRKPTISISISAWLRRPMRDWCSWELFICGLVSSLVFFNGSTSAGFASWRALETNPPRTWMGKIVF